MPQLSIHLLGIFQVTMNGKSVDGFRSEREKALLAYLLMERGRPVSREELKGFLWPEISDENASNNLRVSLHRLRHALPMASDQPEFLLVGRELVQVTPSAEVWIDVTAFLAHLEAAKNWGTPQHHAHPERILHLSAAAKLYLGDFLTGFALDHSPAFEQWVTRTRERLHHLNLQALNSLTERIFVGAICARH
jgi:DNA-binding SARP family transcriptional activator